MKTKPLLGPVSAKERGRIRAEIIDFCRQPRTRQEVEKRSGLNGTSAAGYLSGLRNGEIVDYNRNTKKFKTRSKNGPTSFKSVPPWKTIKTRGS